MDEKLQKVLARAGYGSRRELEAWIEAGRVSVNGKRAQLGDRVTENDVIRVDGHVLARHQVKGPRRRVLMYHKPVGEVTSRSDPEGRPTVFDRLPRLRTGRWVAVGRLDLNTAGLLLLTTDGELANRLMHPSAGIEREYAVRVLGEVPPQVLDRLRNGVELDDGPAHFDSVRDGGGAGANHWYQVSLREGRYREVRRLWESQGVTVSRLTRVRYGPITLPRWLRLGRWEELNERGVAVLMDAAGIKPEEPEKAPRPPDPRRPTRRSPPAGRRPKR